MDNAAIGAGSQFFLCTAATPQSAISGGTNANLVDRSDFFTASNFDTAMATVDNTTLGVGPATGWSRTFMAGLISSTIGGEYMDNVQGQVLLLIDSIQKASNHAKGRGKVDFRIKVGGAVTGNLQIDGTLLFTGRPFSIGIESALGGSFSAQVTGPLVYSAQT